MKQWYVMYVSLYSYRKIWSMGYTDNKKPFLQLCNKEKIPMLICAQELFNLYFFFIKFQQIDHWNIKYQIVVHHDRMYMSVIKYTVLFLSFMAFSRSIDVILFLFNSLWPNYAIRRQGTESKLAQVMACCLMAPSQYLNQYWLIISKVLWHSSWEDLKIPISKIRLKITFKNHIWISQGPMS